MNVSELQNTLKYMRDIYLSYWYNHTLPLRISKVAEENSEFRITEKHIQALWNNQTLLQDLLYDDTKNSIKVIKQGDWNREPGPDFKNAVIEIEDRKINGAIEIHLKPELWNAHGHQFDPAYKNVVLHVVWENPKNHRIPQHIPVIELKNQLKVSQDKIWELTNISNYAKSCIHPPAACSEFISKIQDSQLTTVFRAAGLSRLHRKAAQFKLSVMKYGLDQAFYLALADAHGFKNNRMAFKKLAEAANIKSLKELGSNSEREAYLWGKSGLLPDITQENTTPQLLNFVKNTWKKWWHLREGDELEIPWSRISQRPLNSPERRLAALIQLLEKCSYNIESLLLEAQRRLNSAKDLKEWFNELFTFDTFWENICNFKTSLKSPCRLIGQARQLDIIINVFLPALAFLSKDDKTNESIYLFYCSLPKCQDNHVLDIAKHKFFIPPSRMKYIIQKAVDQQGIMQLMQDFNLPSTPHSIISFWEELGIPLVENKTA